MELTVPLGHRNEMNSKPLYDSAGGRLGRLSNLISPHSPYDAARSPTLDELVAFVGLASWRGVGQKRLYEIAETGKPYVQSFDELLLNAPTEISANPRNHLDHARRLLDELHQRGVLILLRSDPRFPASLMDLARPPHWLFVQGDVELLKEPSIGIVGTRKPTSDGLFLARYVGTCLRDWGRTTVSGLAMGIDTIAHEQSIRACVPTIAVLGTNILEEYPRGSSSLREKIIASGGAIVSEYIPSVSYSAENFVQRNRLQAALGRVLIPVEWSRKSGTAHTVRFAADLKRAVACLRLNDWSEDVPTNDSYLSRTKVGTFTLPKDQEQFDRFVRESFSCVATNPVSQLSLFGG